MHAEDQFRKAVHLIVDRAMDGLIHSVLSTTQNQNSTHSTTTFQKEEPMTYQPKSKQEVIPNDLQSKKATQALDRVGWRIP